MSVWRLVRLNFGRNLTHFGEVGIGMEETNHRVDSDTLFSAWISAYARLFGKEAVEGLLSQFFSSDFFPFRVSSTFIFQQYREQTIEYIPRPFAFPKGYPVGNDLKFTKTYKKLNYLPLTVWRQWYQGEGITAENCEELIAHTKGDDSASKQLANAGTFAYSESHYAHITPKVAIDRETRATNFYQTGFVQFQEGAGLYFLINFPLENVQLETELKAALFFLGEEGLGGERSSGAGCFTVNWLNCPSYWQTVIEFKRNTHYSLLSLYWEKPLPPNLSIEQASYQVKARGGWICSPFSGRQLRRKMIRMFSAGSVFTIPPQGQLADVTPTDFMIHKIYRSGVSMSLPIQL